MKFDLPTFTTKRLRLRPFTAADYENMRKLDTDSHVVRYLGHGMVRSEAETERNLEKIFKDYSDYGLGLYLVEEKSSKKFMGRSGLIPWKFEQGFVWEIGYTLLEEFWGHGFATEASGFLKKWIFAQPDIRRAVSFIQPDNQASIAVAKKMGMHLWEEPLFQVERCLTYLVER